MGGTEFGFSWVRGVWFGSGGFLFGLGGIGFGFGLVRGVWFGSDLGRFGWVRVWVGSGSGGFASGVLGLGLRWVWFGWVRVRAASVRVGRTIFGGPFKY